MLVQRREYSIISQSFSDPNNVPDGWVEGCAKENAGRDAGALEVEIRSETGTAGDYASIC
jgi:hypothetical protein